MKIAIDIPAALAQANAAKQQAKAAAPASQAAAQASAQGASAHAGVPVSVSEAARELDPASRNSGEFDANKVKAMRAAIANGTFKIDAGAIADKLLSNAQEFIVPSSSH
jgi:negative regulator of flagellin synthesis FlgM